MELKFSDVRISKFVIKAHWSQYGHIRVHKRMGPGVWTSNHPLFAASMSSGGRVVKLLACGARGPGFDSPPRHLDFQRLVISCFQVEIWLKDR